MGFKIGNATYSESENNLSSTLSVINYFDAGLTLNDFKVTNLTATDFSPTADYADADGDLAHPTTPFSMSPRTFEWRDKYDNVISPSNYNQKLGCGSSLNLPLKLRITLPNVKVKSRYGNPSESIPTELVKEYKIGTATGICFAKPNSLYWKNDWGAPGNSTNGGGYNPDHFDPDNGFKASLNPKFPTTGFAKASFTLVMTSNVNDYSFSVLKPDGSLLTDGSVTVDTTGKVTLNSKPSGAVTIKAIFKSDTNQVDYYTFNPTSVWVVPKGLTYYNYANAKTECGTASQIPSRAQLTNSPLNNLTTGGSLISNAYTRAVGGGVFGEWGKTNSTNYPGSLWAGSRYWTRDARSTSHQFVVDSVDGNVYYVKNSYSYYVACLE
ncbi:hypothetical protein RCS94_09795 [Orbaceae bacterium ac157xtp]